MRTGPILTFPNDHNAKWKEKAPLLELKELCWDTKKRMHKTSGQFISIVCVEFLVILPNFGSLFYTAIIPYKPLYTTPSCSLSRLGVQCLTNEIVKTTGSTAGVPSLLLPSLFAFVWSFCSHFLFFWRYNAGKCRKSMNFLDSRVREESTLATSSSIFKLWEYRSLSL